MLTWNFNPFPNLETERLQLRRMTHEHSNDFFMLRSNPEIMKYLDRALATSHDDIKKLIDSTDEIINNNEGINWGVFLKNENRLIGTVGYYRAELYNHRAEIGYMLHVDFWGKGLMQEAVTKAIDFGFNTLLLNTIVGDINPGNNASRKLLLKLNFVKEGYFKENFFFNGKFVDTEIYTLFTPKK